MSRPLRPLARLRVALRPRGQTLLLFVLTTLLVALMVLLTLGVGMRIRENHELQTLADTAAYSDAVATARTLNNVAILNRLQISHWVSMAANQGLISWASAQRAALAAIRLGIEDIQNGTNGCTRPEAADYLSQFNPSLLGDMAQFEDLDIAAGEEVLAQQGLIGGLADEAKTLVATLQGTVGSGALTEALLAQARPGFKTPGEVQVHGGGGLAGIRTRELGGLTVSPLWNRNMQHAAYGTRGDVWIISHGGVGQRLQQIFDGSGGAITLAGTFEGGAVWGEDMEDSSATNSHALWAHDHGAVGINITGCDSTQRPVLAYVRSTDLQDSQDTDVHVYEPRVPEDATPDAEHHTMGRCTICPGVWVRTPSLDPGPVGDAHGQPKLVTVLHRDYASRGRDPWELVFDFDFGNDGDPVRFDNRGAALGNDDFLRQAALSTGMAYYHRKTPGGQGFREFPNLLNPYWRATLVPMDVDATGKADDVPNALAGPQTGWQAEAFTTLRNAGFRGFH